MTWLSSFRHFDLFGAGSDGDVVITTSTVLTRDMYYNSLTINNAELQPRGYKIRVKNALIMNDGVIQFDGKPAAGSIGASVWANGTLFAGGGGGNGSVDISNGSSTWSGIYNISLLGGSGGKAGEGDAGSGEAVSPAIPGTPDNEGGQRTTVQQHFMDWQTTYMNSTFITAGFGANGSTGDNISASGGGGGAGGGNLWIAARSITGTGVSEIRSNGGNGGDGDTFGGRTGGGSGGGGGVIFAITQHRIDNTVTFTANGGTLGAPGNGGGDGNDGDPGQVFICYSQGYGI